LSPKADIGLSGAEKKKQSTSKEVDVKKGVVVAPPKQKYGTREF